MLDDKEVVALTKFRAKYPAADAAFAHFENMATMHNAKRMAFSNKANEARSAIRSHGAAITELQMRRTNDPEIRAQWVKEIERHKLDIEKEKARIKKFEDDARAVPRVLFDRLATFAIYDAKGDFAPVDMDAYGRDMTPEQADAAYVENWGAVKRIQNSNRTEEEAAATIKKQIVFLKERGQVSLDRFFFRDGDAHQLTFAQSEIMLGTHKAAQDFLGEIETRKLRRYTKGKFACQLYAVRDLEAWDKRQPADVLASLQSNHNAQN